jgi:CBS domain-containing protein
MIDENIARIPVCDNGKLIGIISDNEIVIILAKIKSSVSIGKEKHRLEELLVKDAMKSPAIWARPNITVFDGAKIMMKHHVGALPLIEENKIVGIVTRTDLIKTVSG